jgi:hypothetical protein
MERFLGIVETRVLIQATTAGFVGNACCCPMIGREGGRTFCARREICLEDATGRPVGGPIEVNIRTGWSMDVDVGRTMDSPAEVNQSKV